jgi:hypothetical protein
VNATLRSSSYRLWSVDVPSRGRFTNRHDKAPRATCVSWFSRRSGSSEVAQSPKESHNDAVVYVSSALCPARNAFGIVVALHGHTSRSGAPNTKTRRELSGRPFIWTPVHIHLSGFLSAASPRIGPGSPPISAPLE